MTFIICPLGNLFSIDRIGGNKAFENGYVILGNGPDEVLCYVACPTNVALVWRNAFNEVLLKSQRNRRIDQVNWIALAATVDSEWAAQNGAPPVEADAAAAQPTPRLRPVSSGSL